MYPLLRRVLPVFFTSLLVTFFCTGVRAQCPTNTNVVLTSQADVDLHVLLYPNCTDLESLTIGDPSGSDVDDISGLSGLLRLNFNVTSNLVIDNTELTSLNGLQNLIRVYGLTIRNNALLTSLGALSANTSVEPRNITITDNPLLAACSVDLVCNTINDPPFGAMIDISGNTGDCETEADLEASCLALCHPDKQFLSELYEALDGDNWDTNNGWNNSNSCAICDWPYITCDANDRVTEIRIIDDGLGGDLENLDWTLMPQLLAFELKAASNINVGPIGPIPAGLFDLPLIEEIQFRFGTFTSLPANIGNAVTLRTFVLDDEFKLGRFDQLPALGTLVNLERLVIDRTDLGGPIPPGISLLVNLKELEISAKLSGNFTFNGDLPDLSNLSQLETLDFTQLPNVTGWPTMVNSLANKPLLTSMKLDASNMATPALPATFPGLPALEEFLIQTDQTGELPFLPNSSNLMEYTVNGLDLNAPASLDIAPTTVLSVLNIEMNNFGGPLPEIPAGYAGLTNVFMGFNAFTGGIPESYNIAGLRRLNLRGNQLGGLLPEFLGDINFNFSNALDLSFNQFVGCYPDSYDDLFRLSFGNYTYYANFDGNAGLGDFADFIQNGEACPAGCSEDYLTLLDFHFATGGENWTRRTGWDGSEGCDLGLWEGVTVDGNGRVTGLDLPANNLTGELFPGLTDLDELAVLNLSVNNLTGCYPVGYDAFCSITTNFFNNSGLPSNGSPTFFSDRFCTAGDACGDDCPSQPTVLTTDAEITAFVAAWPNCTEFTSDLTISGAAITDISPLGDTEVVMGDLTVSDLTLTNIAALSQTADIGGTLTVDDCPNLTIIDFSNLEGIGGGLTLRDLPALTTYRVAEVPSLGGDLNFTRTGLTVIDGLDDLQSVAGNFVLFGNTNLTSIDLGGAANARQAVITSVGGMTVAANPVLSTLVGLPNFIISGDVTIASNATLATCEAEAVCNKLSAGTGSVLITNNATGCASVGEVENACLVLPVTWVDFTATARAKSVDLAWVTADEQGNDRYTVARSDDGRSWSALGEVPAGSAGADGLFRYRFDDQNPLSGESFYRIRQLDLDGTMSFSVVRTVEFIGSVQVYPNPAGQSFTLASATPQVVTIYAADGKLMRSLKHTGARTQVQREGLRSGVYWLRFSESGEVVKLVLR